MSFTLKFNTVAFMGDSEDPTTQLVGELVEGEISGPEWVSLSLSNGSTALLKVIGMEVDGPFTHPEHKTVAGYVGNVLLVLAGHPEGHALVAPGIATGVGKRKPKASKRP